MKITIFGDIMCEPPVLKAAKTPDESFRTKLSEKNMSYKKQWQNKVVLPLFFYSRIKFLSMIRL